MLTQGGGQTGQPDSLLRITLYLWAFIIKTLFHSYLVLYIPKCSFHHTALLQAHEWQKLLSNIAFRGTFVVQINIVLQNAAASGSAVIVVTHLATLFGPHKCPKMQYFYHHIWPLFT